MHANPMLMVKIALPAKLDVLTIKLLRLLNSSGSMTHADKPGTWLLYPPKGTTSNAFWAERTYKKAHELGFPTLIVRDGSEKGANNEW